MLGAARLHEDGEITDLVGNLVEKDGDGGDDAQGVPTQEGCSDSQTVREIVCKIRSQVQVAGYLDV